MKLFKYLLNTGLILFLIFAFDVQGQQLAFPGAEGFGRFTSGGRGGEVFEVTNLNDDNNPGSLRYAINQNTTRTIVFRVSGTIMLQSDLDINYGDLTIAGQTAPGDGICIANHSVQLKANNVIVRYVRFRLGDLTQDVDDAFWGRNLENVIIDHCSISWGIDENGSWYDNRNFTMQWCIISESLYRSYHPKGAHGYGGIWGGMGATFHHNLITNNSSRNPRFNGARYNSSPETELVDFRNNVIFNWGFNSAYGGESGKHNMINNYYKAGPATGSGETQYRIVNPYDLLNPPDVYSKWYIDGNYVEGYSDVSADNWNGGVQPVQLPLDSIRLYSPLEVAPVTTQSAQEAYQLVLENVGADFPKRDSADLRIINEVITGEAPYGATYGGGLKGIIDSQADVGGWPELESVPPPDDSDHDGMPDDWEIANGLNINDDSDRNTVAANGYTMLENYLNELAPQSPLDIKHTDNKPIEFVLLNNYPNPFNPATNIVYTLPRREKVTLSIFNSRGQKVAILVQDQIKRAGEHLVTWNAKDHADRQVSTGVYFYRLELEGGVAETRKMIFMK